jgi:DEAD/DEAH box helicase domain-containing protein
VSLRSASSTNFVVVDTTDARNEVIGEVDYAWAFTSIHEGAIFLVQSEQYHVDRLDWDRRKAYVRRVESEYYTDAISSSKVKVLQTLDEAPPPPVVGCEYGEVEVVRKAVGYKKIKFYTHENLGYGDILLPEDTVHTQALWFTVPRDVAAALAVGPTDLVDALAGVGNVAHAIASFLLMCDGRDLGVALGDRSQEWFFRRTRALPSRFSDAEAAPPPIESFEPTVFLYDQYSGGIGLSEALRPLFPDLLQGARDRIAQCPCRDGCPSCVGPVLEVGERAKGIARRLLDLLVPRLSASGAPLHVLEQPEPVRRAAPEPFAP